MTTRAAPKSLVVVASYPVIMVGAFAGFGLLIAAGVDLTPATYLVVVAAAGLVTWHEVKVPYREQWRPGRREVRTDLVFMVAMQIALPYLLSLAATIWLAGWLRSSGVAVEGIWPHRWPVAVQVVMMLTAADFARYWLHRAFHRYDLMWRYHAVHHSPHRLYWLNVGRFHPFEKAVQYALDALPFALMGVGSEVLAGYFVFYAVNGFFQHSNCDVRLGPLNYVISGPELHRWHHSELIAESNNNYGNNLIIWDVLFGTRFLPSQREVGDLGLINRQYPAGFLAQMRTPFIPKLDKVPR